MPIYFVFNRISGKAEGLLQAADDLDVQSAIRIRWPEAHILDIWEMPQTGYREVVIGQREEGVG